MRHWLRKPALRQTGPWLFVLVLASFWALVAISGWNGLKASSAADRIHRISASDLVGVTRLRVEDTTPSEAYLPPVSVQLGTGSDLRIHPSVAEEDATLRTLEPTTWIMASVEGETLVLRVSTSPTTARLGSRSRAQTWIKEIEAPAHIQHLQLEQGRVHVRAPMDTLTIEGERITVHGAVKALDLRSSECSSHPRRRGSREDGMDIDAKEMQFVRLRASSGRVELKRSEGLQSLELQLGGAVALSLDRVGALDLLPGRAAADASGPGSPGCGTSAVATTNPGDSSRTVALVPVH